LSIPLQEAMKCGDVLPRLSAAHYIHVARLIIFMFLQVFDIQEAEFISDLVFSAQVYIFMVDE